MVEAARKAKRPHQKSESNNEMQCFVKVLVGKVMKVGLRVLFACVKVTVVGQGARPSGRALRSLATSCLTSHRFSIQKSKFLKLICHVFSLTSKEYEESV